MPTLKPIFISGALLAMVKLIPVAAQEAPGTIGVVVPSAQELRTSNGGRREPAVITMLYDTDARSITREFPSKDCNIDRVDHRGQTSRPQPVPQCVVLPTTAVTNKLKGRLNDLETQQQTDREVTLSLVRALGERTDALEAQLKSTQDELNRIRAQQNSAVAIPNSSGDARTTD